MCAPPFFFKKNIFQIFTQSHTSEYYAKVEASYLFFLLWLNLDEKNAMTRDWKEKHIGTITVRAYNFHTEALT